MKKIFLAVTCLLLITTSANAQTGTLTTIAGDGTIDTPPSDAPALSSSCGLPNAIAVDRGRIYFSDYYYYVVSKVDASGNITRYIGDDNPGIPSSGTAATSSEIGLAKNIVFDRYHTAYMIDTYTGFIVVIDSAGIVRDFPLPLYNCSALAIDTAGNLYVGNDINNTVTKITPDGYANIIAGNGTGGFSGDGGPAISAQLHSPQGLAVDKSGNVYIFDYLNFRVRKVSTSGIITTIAGNGTDDATGDGGLATNAAVNASNLDIDDYGNLYLTGGLSGSYVNRKIDPSGIISSPSFLEGASDMCVDNTGTIYLAAGLIQKFIPSPAYSSAAFQVNLYNTCSGPHISVAATTYDLNNKVVVTYGDGNTDTSSFFAGSFGVGAYSLQQHEYVLPGSYTIKTVMYNTTTPIDSFTTSYMFIPCNGINIDPFIDRNGNCTYQAGFDDILSQPIRIAIDSNGIAKDTISITSGLYYRATGNTGDVYSFRVISHPDGISPTCLMGVLYDTLTAYTDNSTTLYPGFTCAGGSGTDLSVLATHTAMSDHQFLQIAASNAYCTPQNGTITLNISPKYTFGSAFPAPASVSGNTVTWDLTAVSISNTAPLISVYLPATAGFVMPGDTAQTSISFTPVAGDADSLNNSLFIVDTVHGSFDPNYIAVAPEGNILAGSKLRYTIEFENDGNDTAHNIHVTDTLSDHLDPSTLKMVANSHIMNLIMFESNGHTVVKFDLPRIQLPDSSHHNQNTGMLVYDIKARQGLADGTQIINSAGIYFDNNPVVATNDVINTIRIPSVSIAQTASVCAGDTVSFSAAAPQFSNVSYRWLVNTVVTGNNDASFRPGSLVTGDIVQCKLWDVNGDSLLAASNVINPAFLPAPDAGTIVGPSAVCATATISLTATATGGTWSSGTLMAAVVGGVVTGVSAGESIISYSVTNSCGTATDTMLVTVNALPDAGIITGATMVCIGGTITLDDSISGGAWHSGTLANATVEGGSVNGIASGSSIISYTVDNMCGTATDTALVTINDLPDAGTITGLTEVCEGSSITLANTITGGTWTSGTISDATVSGGTVYGVSAGASMMSYSVSNICGTATDTMMVVVNASPDAGVVTGPVGLCTAGSSALNATVPGGTWTSSTPGVLLVNTSGIITAITEGSATIYYNVVNSCGTDTAILPVSVSLAANAGNITGVDTMCAEQSIALTDTALGGNWGVIMNTGVAYISATGVLTGVTNGMVTALYTVSNACGTDTASFQVYIKSTTACADGITRENADNGLLLYPNPNNGTFTISGHWSGTADDISVVIFDVLGQQVYKDVIRTHNGNINMQLQTGNKLATGAYLIRLTDGSEQRTLSCTVN